MLPSVKETPVAGGPKDFMTVRHLTLAGSNRHIGRELARIARDRHKTHPAKGEPAIMRARRDYYYQNYRNHHERMQGAAELYGVPIDGPYDLCSLGYDLDLKPACSTVY